MSRSYKKFPRVRAYYGKSGKYGRNQANRKIRRLPLDYDIPKGRGFKKISNSCEIWDYSFVQFKEWEIQDWEKTQADIANGVETWRGHNPRTLEETLVMWKLSYIKK